MARKPSARVVLNRRNVHGVRLAIADGANAVAKELITTGRPPDAAPFGEGLVQVGGWLTYVDNQKVGGGGTDGRQPKKPRNVLAGVEDAVVAVAGWGFPGRFQQFGTVHHAADPFFTRDRDRIIPRIPSIMARTAKYRIARLR